MFIDLTMPLNEATPVYPGDPAPEIQPAGTFAEAGCLDHTLRFGTHLGTHIDAPGHMIEGAPMLDTYGPDSFISTGKLVGLDTAHPDFSSVAQGDIVLLRTGYSNDAASGSYYEKVPNIAESAATELADRMVRMVGVDAGSVDRPPFPIHKILLAKGVLIIENLVNLDALNGIEHFRVFALPLRLQVEGSPARVVAEVA